MRCPPASAVTKPLSRRDGLIATTGAPCGSKSWTRLSSAAPPVGGGTTCQLEMAPAASPTTSVRSPMRNVSAVTGAPPTVAGSASLGLPRSRMSYRTSWPREVPMKRSSPRPSRRSAVISPSTATLSGCTDSSRRSPPIGAFFSVTVSTISSRGPTCATVTGPESGATAVTRARSRPSIAIGAGAAASGVSGTSRRLPSALRIDAVPRYSSTPRAAPGAGAAGAKNRPSAVTRGGRKSGHTSAAMTKRMARMAEMMTMPPSTTVRAARRSRRIRRFVRARLTTSERAGVPGPPAVSVSALIATSLDLVLLFLRDRRRDREVPVLDDALLAFARDDELDELAGQRRERLARRLVHVYVEEARHRIAAGVRVVRRRLDALAAVLLGQRHRPHPRRGVPDTAVADAVAVHRDALDDRRRTRLLLDLVLEIAVLQRVLLEEAVGARRRVTAVQAERLVRPIARQPELAPRPDVVLVTRTTRLREDRVDLSQRQARDGVVLVDEHGERVHRRANGRRLVAVLLLERVELRALHLARHRAEL